jgi:ribonuclease G
MKVAKLKRQFKIIDKIAFDLERVLNHKDVVLNVQLLCIPYQRFSIITFKWFLEHKKWVKIIPRDAYTYLNIISTTKKKMLS